MKAFCIFAKRINLFLSFCTFATKLDETSSSVSEKNEE